MNNWLIAPVLVPALMGPLMVLWMRHDLLQQRSDQGSSSESVIWRTHEATMMRAVRTIVS